MKAQWQIKIEPRDLWVGLYWDRQRRSGNDVLHLYFCFVPIVVLHIQIFKPL